MVIVHLDFSNCRDCCDAPGMSPQRKHFRNGIGDLFAMSFCMCPEGQRRKKEFKLKRLLMGSQLCKS